MPATTRTPTSGKQPLGPLGAFGPPPTPGPNLAGSAPRSIFSGITPSTTRQGSEKMHPLLYAFSQAPAQERPPVNPAGRPLLNLIPELLASSLTAAEARYIASLTPAIQKMVVDQAYTSSNELEHIEPGDVVASLMQLALTPGAPTPEDVREAAADALGMRPGKPYTDDELSAARASLQAGGGTDAPEPTDEELYTEAAAARRQDLIDRGLLFSTRPPVLYSPGEEIPEPPAPED